MYNLSCHIFSVKILDAIKIYSLLDVVLLYRRNRKMKNLQLTIGTKIHSTFRVKDKERFKVEYRERFRVKDKERFKVKYRERFRVKDKERFKVKDKEKV